MNGPDFIIVGAMKCATSTLHDQLAAQPGFFMTEPKEPNFFSDDPIYGRGFDWYEGLFHGAAAGHLRGESSTHYTKRPKHPLAFERVRAALPDIKVIYMMRHPIDRLVSHYIHDWSEKKISVSIDKAIDRHPDLIAFSRYNMQLEPYLDGYGSARVLPIFLKHFTANGQAELERVCRFLDYDGTPTWQDEQQAKNVSAERLALGPLAKFLVDQPILAEARRRLVPQALRDTVKGRFQMRKRPELSPHSIARLEEVFDEDLAKLGERFGVPLSCATFNDITATRSLEWAA